MVLKDMDITPLISDQQKDVVNRSRVYKKNNKIEKVKLTKQSIGNKMSRKKGKFFQKARAAIYIGHIPHGFYEDEMNAYFNQFGKVHSATVARSKKTGRSKGYGFVEFEDEEVAKIAAETMNNYLMYNRVLKCRYISPEERKQRIPVSTVYPVLPKVKNRIAVLKNKKKAFQKLDQNSYNKKAQKKIDDFKKFFEERGIDFSFKKPYGPGRVKSVTLELKEICRPVEFDNNLLSQLLGFLPLREQLEISLRSLRYQRRNFLSTVY